MLKFFSLGVSRLLFGDEDGFMRGCGSKVIGVGGREVSGIFSKELVSWVAIVLGSSVIIGSSFRSFWTGPSSSSV